MISLFKNGLAVLTREVPLDGPGTYVLEQVPSAVHSTLWLEGPEDLETKTTLREIEVGDGVPDFSNLQEPLAGRDVTLHLKGENARTMRGTVRSSSTPSPQIWDREYDQGKPGMPFTRDTRSAL